MFVPPPFYFPLELYVYITLTNNYLAFLIYQLITVWTISINWHRWLLVNNHTSNYNLFILVLYRRYINYVSVCPPAPHPHFLEPSYATAYIHTYIHTYTHIYIIFLQQNHWMALSIKHLWQCQAKSHTKIMYQPNGLMYTVYHITNKACSEKNPKNYAYFAPSYIVFETRSLEVGVCVCVCVCVCVLELCTHKVDTKCGMICMYLLLLCLIWHQITVNKMCRVCR